MINRIKNILKEIKKMPLDEKIKAINEIKLELHKISPFKNDPVDCVLWVKNEKVQANDYNPNSVAPPEMELLKHSILQDGYTQPIVSMPDEKSNKIIVIDGFHRNRVGKECKEVKDKLYGYLPIVSIRETQEGRSDRVASTIRHNRARGKHRIDSMSEIIVDLKKRNWSNKKISKELGMDADEILRLSQISGLTELFANKEFSMAWEAEEQDTNNETID